MLISARLVRARKPHKCVTCGKQIDLGTKHLRLYGAAETCDPPYVLREHVECNRWKHHKIATALCQGGVTDAASL